MFNIACIKCQIECPPMNSNIFVVKMNDLGPLSIHSAESFMCPECQDMQLKINDTPLFKGSKEDIDNWLKLNKAINEVATVHIWNNKKDRDYYTENVE